MSIDESKSSSAEYRRAFPVRCIECGAKEVRPAVISCDLERNHDGKLYRLHIPELRVHRCGKCGEMLFDQEADEQVLAALRMEIGLLSPEEIRSQLDHLELSQKEFAGRLGVAPESVSRWLNGAMVQSRLADNAMRWFFGIPAVRQAAGAVRQRTG